MGSIQSIQKVGGVSQWVGNSWLELDNHNYIITDEILGRGEFSSIYVGIDKSSVDGSECAVKIIKKKLPEDRAAMLVNERVIMTLIGQSHPNIIGLKDIFEDFTSVYIVMEKMNGGDLFERLVQMGQSGCFGENEAREIFQQLLQALQYLHQLGIVHRDVKLENLLLSSPNENKIKLSDFGLACFIQGDGIGQLPNECVGTVGYASPEVLQTGVGYGTQVDMWSAGVLLYILLCGFPPFYDEDLESMRKARFSFPARTAWDTVSAEAKDLITKLLVVDPSCRLTAEQALHHQWMKSFSTSKGGFQDHAFPSHFLASATEV